MRDWTKNMRRPARLYLVRIQEEAVQELDSLYRRIFNDAPRRARSFVKQLQKKIFSLRKFPRRGSRVKLLEDSKEEIRFLEHQGYLIFYTIIQKNVTVLHIAWPGQNWSDLFN